MSEKKVQTPKYSEKVLKDSVKPSSNSWASAAAATQNAHSGASSENKPFSFAAAAAKGASTLATGTPVKQAVNSGVSNIAKPNKSVSTGGVTDVISSEISFVSSEITETASFANKTKARFGDSKSSWINPSLNSESRDEPENISHENSAEDLLRAPGAWTNSWASSRPFASQAVAPQPRSDSNTAKYSADFQKNKRDYQPGQFRRGSNYDGSQQQYSPNTTRPSSGFAPQQRPVTGNPNGVPSTSVGPGHRSTPGGNFPQSEASLYTTAEKNVLMAANDMPDLSLVRPSSSAAINSEEEEDTIVIPPAGANGEHALRHEWGFWYLNRGYKGKNFDYEDALILLSEFGTVEQFWALYCRIRPVAVQSNGTGYHLFTKGTRPMWEDHPSGGKWILRIRKGFSRRLWETLLLAMIGDQFSLEAMNVSYNRDHGNAVDTTNFPEVYGAVLSIRGNEDYISVWNKSANQQQINSAVRDTIRRVLGLPECIVLEYKPHQQDLLQL